MDETARKQSTGMGYLIDITITTIMYLYPWGPPRWRRRRSPAPIFVPCVAGRAPRDRPRPPAKRKTKINKKKKKKKGEKK